MRKLAGILDKPKPTLPPDVWDRNLKLLPQVRRAILDRIRSVFPMEKIKALVIIGSITGFKYNDTSDIDVNVGLDMGEDPTLEEKKLKTHVTKEINGVPAPGTRHPINFFVQKYHEGMITGYEDATFGSYDVLRDMWINPPPNREEFRDPEHEFRNELLIANHIAEEFDRKADLYRSLYGQYNQTGDESVRARALNVLETLIELSNSIDDERKFAYHYGWGVPREGIRNIIYKHIQHGPNGDIFKKIEETFEGRQKPKELIQV